jgi:microcin C transport system permease protein
MKLIIGISFCLASVVSFFADRAGLSLPTVSWGYNLSRKTSELPMVEPLRSFFDHLGHIMAGVMLLAGLWLITAKLVSGLPNPVTVRKIQRFREIKRGYYSFLILMGLAAFASLDQIIVGNEALAVKYDGKWSFPAFTTKKENNGDLGISDPKRKILNPNYRELNDDDDFFVIMPLWPYAATSDTIAALGRKIDPEKSQYDGLGTVLYDPDKPQEPHLRYLYRNGKKKGEAQGWDKENNRVFRATYVDGQIVEESVSWTGEGDWKDFLPPDDAQIFDVSYPPSEPQLSHPLGTTTQGEDVLAYLYGGLQVNFKAILIYIPLIYLIGVTLGLLMGYFGGWFDLVVQRLIEVLQNIPFLFLVIVVTLGVPAQYKDRVGIYLILLLLVVFGWMGMTNLLRTTALKEKSRDYIAASRVIGAGTSRILFRHLLPNSIAVLVTLIPFSVSGVILSLTALDFLGFVPSDLASWGKLLREGVRSLNSPWLVSSAFFSLVFLLVLVTFVGEAVREAFDPKKYTYYR